MQRSQDFLGITAWFRFTHKKRRPENHSHFLYVIAAQQVEMAIKKSNSMRFKRIFSVAFSEEFEPLFIAGQKVSRKLMSLFIIWIL